MNISESIHEENLQTKGGSGILLTPEKKDLRPRKNLIPGMLQEQKRTYIKVPKESKEQLFELVFKEGFKIKEAARKLQIKYATAKTIVFHLRKKCQKQKKLENKFSRYIQLQENIIVKLKIISIIQKKVMSCVEYSVQHPSNGQCYLKLQD
ncbi:unnamed protein product [Paramecium pentaurelia]|uniref:Uncharacterized protein n=1 Tax=Paramecium pentaurelia TaxID=43138 RepID=A0A8S1Y513_9CILI|nr:unnamed protein product [Paramecium pentaurelia]